jgi:sulfite exporter TauE/SafE
MSQEILNSYFLKISVGLIFLGFFMKTLYQSQKCCKVKSLNQNALALGFLNGLLPCGWLYMSLYILSQTQTSFEIYCTSILIFWLGTIPIFGILKFKTLFMKYVPYLNHQSFKFLMCVIFGLSAFVAHYKEPNPHALKTQQTMCLSK